MTDAARFLGLTQSAVSQVVHQIEREVGTPLFDRTRRPLRLTASGVVLTHRAEHIIEEAEQLVAATRSAATIPELRIGLIDSIAGTVGPHVARMFMAKVENLMLWSGLTARLSQDFLSRNVDLVICAEEIEDVDGLRQVPLLREPFVLAVPKAMASTAHGASFEALAEAGPMIRYSSRSHIGIQIERHLRRIGLRPHRRVEMDSSESLLAMVAAGVGWAITTPLCVVHGRPDMAQLLLLPLPGFEFSRHVVLIHRRGEYDELAECVARIAWDTLEEHVVPAVRRQLPFAANMMIVERPAGAAPVPAARPRLIYRQK